MHKAATGGGALTVDVDSRVAEARELLTDIPPRVREDEALWCAIELLTWGQLDQSRIWAACKQLEAVDGLSGEHRLKKREAEQILLGIVTADCDRGSLDGLDAEVDVEELGWLKG